MYVCIRKIPPKIDTKRERMREGDRTTYACVSVKYQIESERNTYVRVFVKYHQT